MSSYRESTPTGLLFPIGLGALLITGIVIYYNEIDILPPSGSSGVNHSPERETTVSEYREIQKRVVQIPELQTLVTKALDDNVITISEYSQLMEDYDRLEKEKILADLKGEGGSQ